MLTPVTRSLTVDGAVGAAVADACQRFVADVDGGHGVSPPNTLPTSRHRWQPADPSKIAVT